MRGGPFFGCAHARALTGVIDGVGSKRARQPSESLSLAARFG
jgi:hypothetical protein